MSKVTELIPIIFVLFPFSHQSNTFVARLTAYANEIIRDYQCEFQCYKSTCDHIFYIRQCKENMEYRKKVHQLFIDHKKTYDFVKRKSSTGMLTVYNTGPSIKIFPH